MALSIKIRGKEAFWYMGQNSPISYNDCDLITEIQADGDELTHILGLFSNIPMFRKDNTDTSSITRGYSMRWFGDDAKYIVANIAK